MKIPLALGAIAIAVTAIGSYTLGYYRGKAEMDIFAGNLVSGISATIRGESLPLIMSAADALNYPEQQEFQEALRRYARAQALAVKQCAASEECSALTGKPLPPTTLVESALSYK